MGLKTTPRLLGSNCCFAGIIPGVVPHWYFVSTDLNAPEKQSAKTAAFLEVLTLADDQLIKLI